MNYTEQFEEETGLDLYYGYEYFTKYAEWLEERLEKAEKQEAKWKSGAYNSDVEGMKWKDKYEKEQQRILDIVDDMYLYGILYEKITYLLNQCYANFSVDAVKILSINIEANIKEELKNKIKGEEGWKEKN